MPATGTPLAILTCMVARLDPAKYAGLSRGRCAADDVTRINGAGQVRNECLGIGLPSMGLAK